MKACLVLYALYCIFVIISFAYLLIKYEFAFYAKISKERKRQNKIHPEECKQIIDPFEYDDLKTLAEIIKEQNDYDEKSGHGTWHKIFLEELLEIFTEKDQKKREIEIIQLAALCKRFYEWSRIQP